MNTKRNIFPIGSLILAFFLLLLPSAYAQEPYFTEKTGFGETPISILEERISLNIDSKYNTTKSLEYLLKNISDTEEIPFYFASVREAGDLKLKLDGEVQNLKQIQDFSASDFYSSRIIEIIDPFTKQSVGKDVYRVNIQTYPKVYRADLKIAKGEFARITLEYPSSNIAPPFINIINPVETQIYELLPSKYLVDGAAVYLELSLPEHFNYISNIHLFKRPDGKYSAVVEKNAALNWNITFASSEGLLFMTNFINTHNENVLKALASTLILSIIMFLVKHRELTKNKQSEFALLKSRIFGTLSLIFFVMSVIVCYFIKLPANLSVYWNYLYAIFVFAVLIASYVFYKNKDRIKLDFSEKQETQDIE